MSTEDKEVYIEMTLLDLEEKYGRTANGRRELPGKDVLTILRTAVFRELLFLGFRAVLGNTWTGSKSPRKAGPTR